MFSTYGMIAKFQEHKKKKTVQVDGIAASAFAFMLCFADHVECLDVSLILFHRAAMGGLEYEKDLSEAERKILDGINAKARQALEARASSDKFEAVTGVSYDELFSMDNRKDVIINALQAKELGFVHKINDLTPMAKSDILALANTYGVAAFAKEPIVAETTQPQKKRTNDRSRI